MLAANPNALVIVPARCAPEAHKCFSSVARFPSSGVRDVDQIGIIGRDSNAHRTRSAAADTAITVNKAPELSRIIRPVHSGPFLCFHGGVHAMRLTRRNRDADAAQTSIVRRWQALR